MLTLPQPWPTNPWPTRFRTVRVSDAALSPDLDFVTVQSPSLGGRGDLALFVPPAAEDHTSLPLVILLHGVYGSFWNWAFNGGAHLALLDLIAAGEVGPMVLAMPSDGLSAEGTAYLPHPDADYEGWIIDDVPMTVTEAVDAVDADSPMMIAGNSMGGFGALRLGSRYPDRIAAVAAHSPVCHLDDLAAFTVADIGDVAGLPRSERSVLDAIATASESMPSMLIDCGTDDPLIDSVRLLRDDLVERDLPVDYEEYHGGHNWDGWKVRIRYSLRFFDRVADELQLEATR